MSAPLLLELPVGRRRLFLRWTIGERLQHWTLAGCFFLLVLTGFALAYPEAFWVRPFSGIPGLFDLRRVLHRAAGALLLLLGLVHAAYMTGTRRGRALAAAFRPEKRDLRDLADAVRYDLGLRRDRPEFGHFSYAEKLEYAALLWGVLIMGTSGLMLWFENATLALLPKWTLDLAATVHLYEAWLATLAIGVWHFYAVIFDPDVYPIDRSMIDGTITEEELRRRHAREWRQWRERLDQRRRARLRLAAAKRPEAPRAAPAQRFRTRGRSDRRPPPP